MKGVVLAGGLGSRLRPLTAVTNKHLLPVYDQPMIYYPIQTLVNAGITDIMIVTGGNSAGDFLKLLGNGKAFGLKHLNYTYQEGEGGIAAALSLVEHFAAAIQFASFSATTSSREILARRFVPITSRAEARRSFCGRCPTRSVSAFPNWMANASCASKRNLPGQNRSMP